MKTLIVLIAVGNGSSNAVKSRIQALGTNVLLVQAGSGLLDEARDADNGSMRAMRGTEGIADENAVAESGELF